MLRKRKERRERIESGVLNQCREGREWISSSEINSQCSFHDQPHETEVQNNDIEKRHLLQNRAKKQWQ